MQSLAQAPMEFTVAARKNPVVITIPMPDGTFARFAIQQSPISLPDPSGKASDFLSFSGQGIDDRTATLRGDISPAGFHAQIISSSATVYVDPSALGDTVNCISYRKSDLPGQERFLCMPPTTVTPHAPFVSSGERPLAPNGATLLSARTAIAVTGEYTTFFRQMGDTDDQAKDKALAAIKVTMNRVNGIWERDAAVRYVLLADVDELKIIYTDGMTDPYTNNDAGKLAEENQTNLDAVIMDANYDVGHVFSTSQGGVGAGGVCVTGGKARGATGQTMPLGDPFDVDYVAHEIVHQWGAGHTFNDNMNGSCPGNREADVAVEPGSGSTTASYAGICSPANLQASSDDNFHSVSIAQIFTWVTNSGACLTKTPTGNTPPAVSAPASFTIPQNTPFTLTAAASDVDGDTLTYDWEEIDTGAASPPETDDGTRPIFRPYRPTTSPSRTFPSLPYILNNANNPPATFMGTSVMGAVCADGGTCISGEVMPTTTRTMKFRVTVRDNRAGGGGINDALTNVNVRADSGPFVVTAPNTNVTLTGGAQTTVTWDVANTSAAPVSADNVKITLSTDSGQTFPTVVAASVPNNGSANVTVPNVATTTARIKVEAVGNIFFDISDADFTIERVAPDVSVAENAEAPAAPAGSGSGFEAKIASNITVTAGDQAGFHITFANHGNSIATGATLNDPLPAGETWSISGPANGFTLNGAPGSQTVSFGPADLAAGASVTVHVVTTTVPSTTHTLVLTDTATGSATNEPPDESGDDTATSTVTVLSPDVRVAKSADVSTVKVGAQAGYLVTLSNSGDGTAKSASLSDSLPAGATWSISGTANGFALNGAPGSQILSFGPGDVSAGASFSVHVIGTTQSSGSLINVATGSALNEASGDTGDDLAAATITVGKASPTVSTTASADTTLGSGISDAVTVAGGFHPTGTVTVRLFGPNDITCVRPPIFTVTKTIDASGNANSGDFTPKLPGTYVFAATYNGDSNNNATSIDSGDETVVVSGVGAEGNGSVGPATFSFSDEMAGRKGRKFFSYSDPSCPISFNTSKISPLTISGNHASFTGTARVGRKTTVNFTVQVDENGPGSSDHFSITLSNGCSRSGNLTRGDIVFH